VTPPERIRGATCYPRGMSLADYFLGDRFAASNGITLLEMSDGFARARLAVDERHLNAAGVVQGGAIFTLADFAFAAACNSHGTLALAVGAHLAIVRGVRKGDLLAEAREDAMSRKISTCTVRVTDGGGALVALFTGTAYKKGDPLPGA
jgi:acyl-CoA thioesterase